MLNSAIRGMGVDMEFQVGADAIHPPGFPASPPIRGVQHTSFRGTSRGEEVKLPDHVPVPARVALNPAQLYENDGIIYIVPEDELAQACATAKDQALAAGFELLTSMDKTSEPTTVFWALLHRDGVLAVITGSQETPGGFLTFMRVSPAAAPEEAEEPSE